MASERLGDLVLNLLNRLRSPAGHGEAMPGEAGRGMAGQGEAWRGSNLMILKLLNE